MIFDAIVWNVSPEIFSLGPVTVRWYGLMFALAFVVGYKIMEYVYKKEGMPDNELDRLSIHMILGVIIGARLGHVLFYQPEEYFANPIDILKIWEGGLASHGAAIGILIALFIYARKKVVPSYMWILDRIILTVPIGGFFVRMGNLFNSEIYGHETNLPWGFIFVRDPDGAHNPLSPAVNGCIENMGALFCPRHPTQLYEGLAYLLIFLFLFSLYRRYTKNLRPGYLFGLFLILLFGIRLIVEFFKENQVAFENNLPLNMGQILSIPFIIVGVFILIRSYRIAPGEKI